jgi:hypothetical protein
MAIKGVSLLLLLNLWIGAELLCDPFSVGYNMGNLGTILWYNGYSARQSCIPAAICDSSLKRGFDIAVVSYYGEMDNLQDRYLYQLSGGGFLTYKHFYIKANFSYFDAFNTYFEQSLSLSAALSLVRSLNISLEGRAYRVGLSGVGDAVHTIGDLGLSAWLGLQFVAFSLQCKHLIIKKSNFDGMDPQMSVICGIHTPLSRFGAQGVMLEITPHEVSPLRWKIGEEVRVLKWLAIQVGIANNPVLVGLGLSIDLQYPSVAVALVNQPQLGWSRGIYMGYSR